jgi:hypothetical protein
MELEGLLELDTRVTTLDKSLSSTIIQDELGEKFPSKPFPSKGMIGETSHRKEILTK